jgi:superfamily II DNA or RNA helicase
MPDKLQPHQSRVIKKLDTTNGLVVNHGTGSGKTLTALLAAHKALKKNPGGQVLYLSPASITGRVDEEIRKHKIPIDRDRLVVRSYEKAINDREELGKGKYSLVIADEAHKLRI